MIPRGASVLLRGVETPSTLSPDFPLGDAVEVFVTREDAKRFIEEVRRDEPSSGQAQDRGAGA